jgi:hypothetical protein
MALFAMGPSRSGLAGVARAAKPARREAAGGPSLPLPNPALRVSGTGAGSLSATSCLGHCRTATSRRLLPEASFRACPGRSCRSSVRGRRPMSRPATGPARCGRPSARPSSGCFFPPSMFLQGPSARCSRASRCPRRHSDGGARRRPSRFRAALSPCRRWQSMYPGGFGQVAARARRRKPAGR